jgi:hypothetical protein
MKQGELLVSGTHHVRIHIGEKPSKVEVAFKDVCEEVPCNPPAHEDLDWEVKHSKTHHGYDLIIRWKVAGVREIAWAVYF